MLDSLVAKGIEVLTYFYFNFLDLREFGPEHSLFTYE
jgi:hypothetical protein